MLNCLNKCSSQLCVVFSLQQHTIECFSNGVQKNLCVPLRPSMDSTRFLRINIIERIKNIEVYCCRLNNKSYSVNIFYMASKQSNRSISTASHFISMCAQRKLIQCLKYNVSTTTSKWHWQPSTSCFAPYAYLLRPALNFYTTKKLLKSWA